MSYTKTNWTNDTAPAINETNLNKIEQGIYDNDSAISNTNTNVGDLTSLTTTANTDLVSAINEVDGNTDINTAKLNGTQAAGDMVVDSIKTKNLCDINSTGVFPNSSGTVSANYCFSAIIDTTNMTTLYISGNFSLVSDSLLRIGKYNSYPKQGSTGTRANLTANGTINVSNTNYLVLAFIPANNVTLEQIKNSFMLVEGTSASTWKPCQNLDTPHNIYSVFETKIGTWIDGKPLYRKVIDLGNLPNATVKSLVHGISNLGILVHCFGTAKRGDGSILVLPNVDKDGLQYSVRLSADSSNLHITTGSDRSAFSGYAIMEYTKTTD